VLRNTAREGRDIAIIIVLADRWIGDKRGLIYLCMSHDLYVFFMGNTVNSFSYESNDNLKLENLLTLPISNTRKNLLSLPGSQ
jgi:hypothetical protein